MRNAITVAVLAVSLAGCASMQPVTLTTQFDPAEVAWASLPGTGSVTGQAFFQTAGGEPRTCAGQVVELVPDSTFLRERLAAIYGNTTKGFRPLISGKRKFADNPPAYQAAARQSPCDAQGNFAFTDLPAGRYYVVAGIGWTLPGNYLPSQGGWLMESLDLAEGESKRVILTP